MFQMIETQATEHSASPFIQGQSQLNIIKTGSLGALGSLEVRIARNANEIRQAQRLRYQIFMQERGVAVQPGHPSDLLDRDRFDAFCDHLIVVDKADDDKIVGTYRLLSQDKTTMTGGFYSGKYFEIEPLVSRHRSKRFLELGRSCVLEKYRTKRTVELLWQGIWTYCAQHKIDVLIGCASFLTPMPAQHAMELSFLKHYCLAEDDWNISARTDVFHTMNLVAPAAIDQRSAFCSLPPLMKGYLRVGAKVGDGCVIDHELDTTVVMIVLPVSAIASRYAQHFGAEVRRLVA
jgi:L-ornithine Nalpha-acyltransferase